MRPLLLLDLGVPICACSPEPSTQPPHQSSHAPDAPAGGPLTLEVAATGGMIRGMRDEDEPRGGRPVQLGGGAAGEA